MTNQTTPRGPVQPLVVPRFVVETRQYQARPGDTFIVLDTQPQDAIILVAIPPTEKDARDIADMLNARHNTGDQGRGPEERP